ncbi:hypothetical protein [Streptomyces sp. 8N706]|uniref:hypothetical protein n=1 Tax=Streptomyces sp. 8N706 TaxID=3457416 RepID=UPI003FD1EABA
MLLRLLRAALRHRLVRIGTASLRPPPLPPIARALLPDATGKEAETYNRARKATAVALLLFRAGYRETAPTTAITSAVQALGWKQASGPTHAAVRAVLGVLAADPTVRPDR